MHLFFLFFLWALLPSMPLNAQSRLLFRVQTETAKLSYVDLYGKGDTVMFLLKKSGEELLFNLEHELPLELQLQVGTQNYLIWLLPNKELKMRFDGQNPVFEGDLAKENAFLQQHASQFEVEQKMFDTWKEDFQKKIGEWRLQKNTYMGKAHKEAGLGEDFKRYLALRIKCIWANAQFKYHAHKKMTYDDLSFFSFLEKMNAESADLLYVAEFQKFINNLVEYKAVTKKRPSSKEMLWADKYEACTKWMKDSVAVFTLSQQLQKAHLLGYAFYMQACYEHYKQYPVPAMLAKKLEPLYAKIEKPAFDVVFIENETLISVLQRLNKPCVYIDFWASWCKPCKEEFPYLLKVKQELEQNNANFGLLYLSMDENTLAWKNEALRNKLAGWHLRPSPEQRKEIEQKYSVPSLPFGILVDQTGKMLRGNVPRFSHGPKAKQVILEQLSK